MSKASSDLNRELAIMKRFAKTLDECTPDQRMRILNWCDTRRQHEIEATVANTPKQEGLFPE